MRWLGIPHPRNTVALAVWTVFAVFVTAFIGITLTRESGRIASIWLANAMVLLVLLRTSPSSWAGWLLCGLAGNLAANLLTGDASVMATVLALCNTLEIALAAGLFRRLEPSVPPELTRLKPLFTFIGVAGVAAPAAAGALAALILHQSQGLPFWGVLRTWFSADALGILIVVPLLAGAAGQEFSGFFRSPKRMEALALLVLVPALTLVVIGSDRISWIFLLSPLFLWAAFRFGFVGAAFAIFLATASGVGILALEGPHAGHVFSLREEISFLQIFLFSNVLMCLPIANLITALKASEERYRGILETTQEGFWIADLRGRLLQVNDAYCRMSGYREQELLAMTIAELEAIENSAEIAAHIQKIMVDGLDRFETRHRRKDGRFFDVEISTQCRPESEDAVIAFARDITERKRAEAALRHSQAMLARTEGLTHTGSWEWDRATDTVVWSEELFHIFERNPAERAPAFSEQSKLFHAEDYSRLQGAVAAALREARPYELELRMARPSGETRWCLARGYPEFDAGGKVSGLFGLLQDITERKQAEEDRRRLDARVSQIQKLEALGILVAGVAHNLNNVLAAIMAMVSLREGLATDAKDLEAFRIIDTACKRGRDVVRSLTQFAKPMLANQSSIELHALFAEVRHLLENTTQNRIQVIEAFTEEPLWIHGDAGNLNHAFMNLCFNALDAMPNGGTLTLRTASPQKGWVEVSVEDTGEGMPPDILARAAEPFFTTKEVGKRTGLGLSMAHGVIKAHGGTLEMASSLGQGTTVKIRFPSIQTPDSGAVLKPSLPASKPLKVLLVDDDEDVRFLVARMLKNAGHQIQTMSGGAEALESLSSGALPDLIILDQNMPRMNGIQTLEKIRDLHVEVPVLISSGQPDIEAWACFKQPNVAVIPKPFDLPELLAKLSQFSGQA
jgi:PAS domain S-box-containing protein